MEGFRVAGKLDYAAAHAELLKTPDGTPGREHPLFPRRRTPPVSTSRSKPTMPPSQLADAHTSATPIRWAASTATIPKTMQVRVTRPGFIMGIAALAKSDDPVPHLPSIERWRKGNRKAAYDPNVDASRQEMRSFVCGQCHVEYYCARKETLFFPWSKGLKSNKSRRRTTSTSSRTARKFYDFEHGETGAHVYKAQHPEFELWSQGVHARSGVSCADCHMPYERQGAMKVSSHWVRSPLLNINNACQTCHNVPEEELRDKVHTIQTRTTSQLERAAVAMTDMLDAIREAEAAGATAEQLAPIFELQKKGDVATRFHQQRKLKGLPRRPGSDANSGRVDRLQPPGAGDGPPPPCRSASLNRPTN